MKKELPYYITVDALTRKEIKFIEKCLKYEDKAKYTDTIIESGLTKVPRLDAIRILKEYVKNATGRDKVTYKTSILLLKHCI